MNRIALLGFKGDAMAYGAYYESGNFQLKTAVKF